MTIYNFTGTNGDPAPGGLTAHAGTGNIQSNRWKALTLVGGVHLLGAGGSSADGFTTATINGNGTASNTSGVYCRRSDNNNFIQALISMSAGTLNLYKFQAGVLSSSLGSYTIPSFSASTDYVVTLNFSGSSLSVDLDGTPRITGVTDSFNSTATNHGLRLGNINHTADGLNIPPQSGASVTIDAIDEFRPYTLGTLDFELTLSGTNSGATAATAIERKVIYADDNSTVAGFDWATYIAAGSVTDPDGSWSGSTITLPASLRKYKVQTRFSDDTGVTAESSAFFSGFHITLTGQSLGNFLYTESTGSPTAGVYYGNGATGAITTPSAGAGAIALGNAIIAYTSLPVLITNSCQGGLAIIENNESTSGYYLYDPITPTPHYDLLLEQITTFNGVHSVINVQFEQDAKLLSGTFADVKTGFQGLVAKIRTDTGMATLPFIMSCLGTRGAGITSDANIFGMREVQKEISDADANMVYINKYDLPVDQTDGYYVHLTTAGNITHGQRLAAAIKNQVLGDSSAWASGKVTSVVQTTATSVVFNITHTQGTDFTPTTAITDISLSTDGVTFSEVPSAVVRTNATSFTATVSSGTYTHFRHNYKALPDLTGVVLDNSALALSLDTMQGAVAAVEPPPPDLGGDNEVTRKIHRTRYLHL